MCTPQAAAIFQVIGTVAQYSARVQQTNMENARREEARRNAARARDIQASQLAIRVKQDLPKLVVPDLALSGRDEICQII